VRIFRQQGQTNENKVQSRPIRINPLRARKNEERERFVFIETPVLGLDWMVSLYERRLA